MDDSVEEWKPVVGFEAYYQVSNWGRVKRTTPRFHRTNPSGLLKQTIHNTGYPRVCPSVGGRKKYCFVHQLVAAAFIGKRPEGYFINHMDGNKCNNRLSNLEYVTPQENDRHARSIGLIGKGASKLTKADVIEVRWLWQYATRRELARSFCMSPSAIKKIVTRKTWTNV